jgi:hypothetical protein
VTIRISTATVDDLPEIVGSVDALFATDAAVHNAAATNLRWGAENGIAYYASLLASHDPRLPNKEWPERAFAR